MSSLPAIANVGNTANKINSINHGTLRHGCMVYWSRRLRSDVNKCAASVVVVAVPVIATFHSSPYPLPKPTDTIHMHIT
jgi:hypothetical protein